MLIFSYSGMDLDVMCFAFGLLCYERVSEPVNARGRQVWTHLQSNTTCGHFECHLFKMVAVQKRDTANYTSTQKEIYPLHERN